MIYNLGYRKSSNRNLGPKESQGSDTPKYNEIRNCLATGQSSKDSKGSKKNKLDSYSQNNDGVGKNQMNDQTSIDSTTSKLRQVQGNVQKTKKQQAGGKVDKNKTIGYGKTAKL